MGILLDVGHVGTAVFMGDLVLSLAPPEIKLIQHALRPPQEVTFLEWTTWHGPTPPGKQRQDHPGA